MTYFDSHAHITSETLFPTVNDLLKRASTSQVEAIMNICTDVSTLERGLELSEQHAWVHNAAATTPHDVVSEGESFFPLVEQLALKGQLKAIGETGLDYYYEHSPRETQKHYLKRYLALALKVNLPVIIHCREAFADFFEILDKTYIMDGKIGPGVLHCFTGTAEEAKQVVARGWYVSFSGIVTFKKSQALREAALQVPLDKLLIETDAPYLAPQRHRGSTNEPAFISETAACLADLKGVSLEDLAKMTTSNARHLFKISPFNN